MIYDDVPDTSEKAIPFNLYSDAFSRPKHGYCLIDCVPCIPASYDNHSHTITDAADSKLEPCIVETHPSVRTREIPSLEASNPTDPSHILEEFCDCTTPEKRVDFATKYGRLTDGQVLRPDSDLDLVFNDSSKAHYSVAYGEPVSLWDAERSRLYDALSIWKAYLSNDLKFLQQHICFTTDHDEHSLFQQYCKKQESFINNGTIEKCITWNDYKSIPSDQMCRVLYNGKTVIANAADKHTDFLLKHIPWNDHKAAAKILVYQLITQALDTFPAKSNLWIDNEGNLKVQVISETILPKIWLRFAEALSGSRYVRVCPRCKKLFEVSSPTAPRKRHDHCGSPIDTAAFRARKKAEQVAKALSEIQSGKSIEEVAASMGLKRVSTLQKWIEKHAKGELPT